MTLMETILIIGAGAYQVPLIKRMKELGKKVFCVDRNESAPGFQYADGYKCIDVLDYESCLNYARQQKINGVATYAASITLYTVSFIAEKLNLPALPLETAKIAVNKYAMKKLLVEKGCNYKGDLHVFHNLEEAKSYHINKVSLIINR